VTESFRRSNGHEPETITVGQLVQTYLRLAGPNLSPRTQRGVQDTLKLFSQQVPAGSICV
jgi:hypothetical protein